MSGTGRAGVRDELMVFKNSANKRKRIDHRRDWIDVVVEREERRWPQSPSPPKGLTRRSSSSDHPFSSASIYQAHTCESPATLTACADSCETHSSMGSFLHVVWVAIVCAGVGAGAWFVTPKGKEQTWVAVPLLQVPRSTSEANSDVR